MTICKEFVYQAFDVEAAQNLLKNKMTNEKFGQVLSKAIRLTSRSQLEMYVCEFAGKRTLVPIGQITHIEIWKRVVTIHYGGGMTAKFYGGLEELELQLSSIHIIRCHRSYLVSISAIAEFQRTQLTLKSGIVVPLGQTYFTPLTKAFSNYLAIPRADEKGEVSCSI